MSKIVTLFTLIFTALVPLHAQTIAPHQINAEIDKARIFENQNDLHNAQRIYQNLYAQYPERADIVIRLENVYARTGQHEKSVAILKQHLKQSPNHLTAQLKLGDALLALGEKEEAFKTWNHMLQDAQNPNPFSIVANKYVQSSLYDRADAVFLQARKQLNMPDLFAKERAELAERQARYADAVAEYLIFVRQSPQYRTMIEARLRDMAQNGEAHEKIFALLTEQIRQNPTDRNNLGMLIEYALPAGFCEKALHLLKETPDLPPNNWTYLARIARYALDEKKFDVAADAYQTLYTVVDRPDVQARALIGLAHTHKQANNITLARKHYQTVIEHFSNRPEADEARFNMGLFQRDQDNTPSKAQATFQEIIDTNRKNEWRYRAFFELAEGYLKTGEYQKADQTWTTVLTERKIGPDAAQARYHMAQLRYYTGKFDEAKVMLNLILVKDLGQDVANDAILQLALIEEAEHKGIDDLRQYAAAERLQRQNELGKAYETLQALQEQNPKTFLADRILYLQAELLEAQTQYTEAIQQHRKLLQTQKNSPLCPAAQMAMAQIYENRLGQYVDAQQVYEALLIDHPLSFEADLARERLRVIQQKIQDIKTYKDAG